MNPLTLRGVPLAVAHRVTERETATASFAAAQRAFDAARGEGTQLLPEPAGGGSTGPAPYVRSTITEMLCRMAEGRDPGPFGEEELSASAEAHLALIEALATEAAFDGPLQPPALAPAGSPSGRAHFGALEVPRPEWLTQALLHSIVRVESVEPPRSTAPNGTESLNPLVRLAAESAHWRGIPPHGARDKVVGEARAGLLASARAGARVRVPVPPVSPGPVPSGSGDEWVGIAAAQLAGIASSGMLTGEAPHPQADAIHTLTAKKMAAWPTPEVDGRRAIVVDAGSALDFLTNFDVMRDYVFQPV